MNFGLAFVPFDVICIFVSVFPMLIRYSNAFWTSGIIVGSPPSNLITETFKEGAGSMKKHGKKGHEEKEKKKKKKKKKEMV